MLKTFSYGIVITLVGILGYMKLKPDSQKEPPKDKPQQPPKNPPRDQQQQPPEHPYEQERNPQKVAKIIIKKPNPKSNTEPNPNPIYADPQPNNQQNTINQSQTTQNQQQQSSQYLSKLPKYPQLCQEMLQILQQLIDNKIIDNAFKFYIRSQEGKQELFNLYQIKQREDKMSLQAHCNGVIQVRINGNCFYTAFAYQLLKYIIKDQQTLNDFQQDYSQIEFKIRKEDTLLINDRFLEKRFIEHFFKILQYFLQIEDLEFRYYLFHLHFAAHERKDDCDGFFNFLSVIFLKNLCNKFVMESDQVQQSHYKSNNFLQWGDSVHQGEVIAELLSKNLRINVKQILFFESNFTVIPSEQQNNNQMEIILLQKNNCYNIGIKENDDLQQKYKQN